jgi:hypothetical protein
MRKASPLNGRVTFRPRPLFHKLANHFVEFAQLGKQLFILHGFAGGTGKLAVNEGRLAMETGLPMTA